MECQEGSFSKVSVSQPGITHDASLRAWLQILVAVDRDNGPAAGCRVSVHVMGPVDACQSPAMLFEDAAHALAGNNLHGASPAASRVRLSSCATASQPSAASRRLANFIERFSLSVASRKCGNRCGKSADFRFGPNNRGNIDGDINNDWRCCGRGVAHGQDPPVRCNLPQISQPNKA